MRWAESRRRRATGLGSVREPYPSDTNICHLLFLLIRPQQKRVKDHRKMIENLKKGDKIVTSGGIHGVIEAVGTNAVTVKIAENVKVKLGKAYIAALRAPSEED